MRSAIVIKAICFQRLCTTECSSQYLGGGTCANKSEMFAIFFTDVTEMCAV